MTAATPTIEPAEIPAGDTAVWLKSLPDYPATEGWVLSYQLVNAGAAYAFNATASGADHLVTVTATTTAGWLPGDYRWRARVSKTGSVYTIASGALTVSPSFGAVVDARSTVRRSLDAVESMLEGRASSGVAEYQIAGRQLRHISIPELLTLRDQLRMDVAREDMATRASQGLQPKGRIFVRFGP